MSPGSDTAYFESPEPVRRRMDPLTIGVSVVVAIFIWFYVDSRRTEDRLLTVPLVFELPDGWDIYDETPPVLAEVMVRGPRQIVGGIQQDQLAVVRRVEPEGGNAVSLNIELQPEDLRGLPRDVSIMQIEPATVDLKLVRLVRRYIKVEQNLVNEPAEGHEAGTVLLSKRFVPVWAPEEEFTGSEVVKTVPIDLAGRREYFDRMVPLQPIKLKTQTRQVDQTVFVQIDIVEKSVSRVFKRVPVRLLWATPMKELGAHTFEPSAVKVTVEGRPDLVESLAASSLTVYVDTRDMSAAEQAAYLLPCKSLAPEGVYVRAIQPAEVRWVSRVPKEPAADTAKKNAKNDEKGNAP